MRCVFALMICSLGLCTVPEASAAEFVFESSAERVQLVQLFTSEGCSSCPPAEEFLSALLEREDLWTRVVPVALHVDYWDHIGWEDPFASPRFTQLQQTYARYCGIENAYTPNFFVDGAEWRGFFERETLPGPNALGTGVLRVNSEDGKTVSVRFEPQLESPEALIAFVAVVGIGCESSIDAGENKRRKLRHDFVALSLQSGKLGRDSNAFTGTFALDAAPLQKAARYGLVAWIERASDPKPVQATGGFLP